MKVARIGSFVILGLVSMIILNQSASIAVKAQVNASVSASISPQPRTQHPSDQAPYKITVQGRLTDPSGNPITSQVNVSFKLYNVASGGSPIFSEGPVSVTPDNRGLLTYQLGSSAVISPALVSEFANNFYLGLTVGSDAEMSPRILLTAAPYALSLAPGTVVQGAYDASGNTTNFGVINGVNTDASSVFNSGVYGKGAIGVYGEADSHQGFGGIAGNFINPGGYSGSQYGIYASTNSSHGSEGYGGGFYNVGGGNGNQYGVQAQTSSSGGLTGYGGSFTNTGGGNGPQYGVYASAGGAVSSSQESVGVVGVSTSIFNGIGGVFTGTTTGGYFYAGSQGVGIYTSGGGSNAVNEPGGSGIVTSGGANPTGGPGGDGIVAYGGQSTNLATFGGFFGGAAGTISVFANADMSAQHYNTRLGYDMMVQYHGSDSLRAGDVIALDGDNRTLHGETILGVVKATAANAGLAVGIVEQRYVWLQGATQQLAGRNLDSSGWQLDPSATGFAPDDVLNVMVLGQTRLKLGKVSFGDELTLSGDGSLAVADASSRHIIATVASQPDKDGYVTVFVNLK